MNPTENKLTEPQLSNDWLPVLAVVTGCKQTATFGLNEESYDNDEFLISFTYEVSGKTYEGKYKAGSPQEAGHTFEILYDPKNPRLNTGSDKALSLTSRVIGVLILTALFIWLEHKFDIMSVLEPR